MHWLLLLSVGPTTDYLVDVKMNNSVVNLKCNKDSSFIIESNSVYEDLKLSEVALCENERC